MEMMLILTIVFIICLAVAIYGTRQATQIAEWVGLIIALECCIAVVVILKLWHLL